MYSEPREPDVHRFGPYEPSPAARLFAALERAGIEFEVELVTEELSVDLEGDSPKT